MTSSVMNTAWVSTSPLITRSGPKPAGTNVKSFGSSPLLEKIASIFGWVPCAAPIFLPASFSGVSIGASFGEMKPLRFVGYRAPRTTNGLPSAWAAITEVMSVATPMSAAPDPTIDSTAPMSGPPGSHSTDTPFSAKRPLESAMNIGENSESGSQDSWTLMSVVSAGEESLEESDALSDESLPHATSARAATAAPAICMNRRRPVRPPRFLSGLTVVMSAPCS